MTETEELTEEECAKSKSCEQVCTNCKCKLTDIEDCVVSTDIEITTEDDDELEENSEEITQIENEEEEIHTEKIDQEEIENITTDEVDVE